MSEKAYDDMPMWQQLENWRARAEAAEAQLKTVLDRESATAARHDVKVEKLEAEVARLRTALRELVEEYVGNVDQYRVGGFRSDPEEEDVVKKARAALEAKP